jgi:ATP-dependent Clp protease protease subunit
MVDILEKYFKDKESYELPDFEALLNLETSLDRNIFLNDIVPGVGDAIDTVIRMWNRLYDEANLPVEERQPIKVYINSGGGDLNETFIMYDSIKNSKTPVWGIVTGAAYSGGFFTLLACHKRIGYKHSSYLYHEGSVNTGGDANKFNNFSDYYKNVVLRHLKEITLEGTKFTEEEYENMRKDDVWLDAEEAIKKGVIDEIATGLL